jgi:hypothetical protein
MGCGGLFLAGCSWKAVLAAIQAKLALGPPIDCVNSYIFNSKLKLILQG